MFQSVSLSKFCDHLRTKRGNVNNAPFRKIEDCRDVDLPSNHVHSLNVLIVRAGLENENVDAGVLGQSASDDAAGGAASVVSFKLAFPFAYMLPDISCR